jgi:hypothetical protein
VTLREAVQVLVQWRGASLRRPGWLNWRRAIIDPAMSSEGVLVWSDRHNNAVVLMIADYLADDYEVAFPVSMEATG